jgi:hypothetical protein
MRLQLSFTFWRNNYNPKITNKPRFSFIQINGECKFGVNIVDVFSLRKPLNILLNDFLLKKIQKKLNKWSVTLYYFLVVKKLTVWFYLFANLHLNLNWNISSANESSSRSKTKTLKNVCSQTRLVAACNECYLNLIRLRALMLSELSQLQQRKSSKEKQITFSSQSSKKKEWISFWK